MISLLWIALVAFALSAGFCLGLRGLARDWYLVDKPDARKTHDGHVPLCGGIAIFLAFFSTTILTGAGSAGTLPLLPGLLLILTCGVLDDRFDLPVAPRLAMQVLAAFLILAHTGLTQLHLGLVPGLADSLNIMTGEDAGVILTGSLFLFVALIFVVGLINAVNMSDGIDGLAGSASAAAFFWLSVIGFDAGQSGVGTQALVLSAACTGFLLFNMRHRWRAKASLFLGDGGSTLLGAALGSIILTLGSSGSAIAFPVMLWVVIVPVTDTLSLIIRRFAARRSPFSADRQHLHHLILDNGFSSSQATVLILSLNFAAGAAAWGALRLSVPAWAMLLGLIVPVLVHTSFVLRSNRRLRPAPLHSVADAAQATKTNATFPGATL
jgi:UDP-GlcNAc:undecaprenyl-phosphate GlcNAc-1-phosphate transferase